MPLKWLCHSDKKKAAGSLTKDTWHRWRKTKTEIWHAVKAGSVKTHGAKCLYDRRERMDEGWRKWAVDGAVQIKDSCWEESRRTLCCLFPDQKYKRHLANRWGAMTRLSMLFSPENPPEKAFTILTADRGIYEYLCDERVSTWEMSWHWVDRTVGATLPVSWLLP